VRPGAVEVVDHGTDAVVVDLAARTSVPERLPADGQASTRSRPAGE